MLKMHPNNYLWCFELIVFLSSFLFLFTYFFRTKNVLPTKWPLVGMLPALLKNVNRAHDYAVEVLEISQLNFLCTGPWLTNMKYLVTADPANSLHVFSKNFTNYPKGPNFKEIFDILGDGIFSVDSEMWKYHRKMAELVFSHRQFNRFLVKKMWEKIEFGLIPIFDHAFKHGLEIELQNVFGKYTFDTITTVVMGYDPGTLSIDSPSLAFADALHDAEEGILYRHVVPTCVWKFQRWLGIGQEKKYKEAWKIIDDFVYGCISRKEEELSSKNKSQVMPCKSAENNEFGLDLMTLYMDEVKGDAKFGCNSDKVLRDTVVNFFLAGLDSTSAALSWLFYLLSTHPHVLSKVKEELDATIAEVKSHLHHDMIMGDQYEIFSTNFGEFNKKLIYLHAAILEALRLYPPVPFNIKTPAEVDTLPSGHQVDPSVQIIFSAYAMGRMKSIWGEDCNEFKPERWLLDTGEIKYVPAHKFVTFNTGPRICLGKNMSLVVMKAAAMAIISKYRIQPVQGHPIVPNISIILRMKHGFKANLASY